MKKIITIGFTVLLLSGIAAAMYVATKCPCEQLPGITLTGEEMPAQINDWSFANDVGLCQLQVDDGLLPQSLNLNCMSAGGELFVSCSRCATKRWSNIALAHPEGRILIGGKIYSVTLNRISDSDQLDFAWLARVIKLRSLGREAPDERPDHWWSFQLTSR